jgi:hypothetical protein
VKNYTTIDTEDLERVLSFGYWGYGERGYIMHKRTRLHNFIMNNYNKNLDVDHINGNVLDNRKSNLKIVSHALNMQNYTKLFSTNTSGYRGVNKYRNKWQAEVVLNKKHYRFGIYNTPEEANNVVKYARAYLMINSKEYREIKQEDIPQWIKNIVDFKQC